MAGEVNNYSDSYKQIESLYGKKVADMLDQADGQDGDIKEETISIFTKALSDYNIAYEGAFENHMQNKMSWGLMNNGGFNINNLRSETFKNPIANLPSWVKDAVKFARQYTDSTK